MHLRTRLFRFSLTWLLTTTIVAADRAEPGLILAVHPYLSHNEINRKFKPLAEFLATRLKRDVDIRIGETYQKHIQAVGDNQVDIAFMGPASYVRLVERFGPRPLLARLSVKGRPVIRGHIVARLDSRIHRLADLEGKRFAFGNRASTMSYLVPQYVLARAGIDLESFGDYRFFRSHEDVAMAVLAGDADAGAMKAETFEKFRARGLRSITTTPGVSEHLFVTRADLSPALIARIRKAMLTVRLGVPNGRKILHSLRPNATALVPVKDADYEYLRKILSELPTPGEAR